MVVLLWALTEELRATADRFGTTRAARTTRTRPAKPPLVPPGLRERRPVGFRAITTEQLAQLSGVAAGDPTHVLIETASVGLTGYEAADWR
jgi:hypothetical protein